MRISILQQVINVESGGGGGMVVHNVLLLLFLFSLQHTFASLSQLISIGIFVHPVCMVTVLCVSPYTFYCN